MASVSAFNDMMGQFIAELHKGFPKESGIKKFMTSFELLRDTNPRKCVEVFMAGVGVYAGKISNKDETFITEDVSNVEFIKDLNIQALWSGASAKTKDAIWQYLQTLYMLGTAINAVPESTLSMIENMAKDAADKLQGGQIDEAALQKMLGGFLGGMTKK
jgi:predicted ATPase